MEAAACYPPNRTAFAPCHGRPSGGGDVASPARRERPDHQGYGTVQGPPALVRRSAHGPGAPQRRRRDDLALAVAASKTRATWTPVFPALGLGQAA